MRRLLSPELLRITAQQEQQAVTDDQEATLNRIISRVKELSTFQEIGALLHRSDQWVNDHLPRERLLKNGRQYYAPRHVVVELIRSSFKW